MLYFLDSSMPTLNTTREPSATPATMRHSEPPPRGGSHCALVTFWRGNLPAAVQQERIIHPYDVHSGSGGGEFQAIGCAPGRGLDRHPA